MKTQDPAMETCPDDRYVFLLSRYGDTTIHSTSEDDQVVERLVRLYDDGTLHDVGCIVREIGEGGRHGLLASQALSDEHEVSQADIDETTRRIGLPVMALRYPDPRFSPEVGVFVPLGDPRMISPNDVTDALAVLASRGTPRADMAAMPTGTTKAGVHKVLKEVLESASIEIILRRIPLGGAADGGPMAAAWGLYADLRGTDMASTLRSIAGRDRPDWNAALAGEGTEPFASTSITAERVTSVLDGLLVHAAAKEWSSSQLGKAWNLAARIHGVPVLEVAESLLDGEDARSVLEANGCEFDDALRPPGL